MSAVEKWKANRQRREAARQSGVRRDTEDGPDSSSATSIRESNNKRLEIQRMRKQQRSNYESGSESEGYSSRRSGGKLKAIRDRIKTPIKERFRPLDKASDDDSDEENQVDNNQDEDLDGVYESITTFELPPHRFPLVVAPMSWETESKQQPSLAIPAPYPNISTEYVYNAITNPALICETGTQKLKESSETLKYASREYVSHFDHSVGDSADDDNGRESGVSELEMLIKDTDDTNISSLRDIENSAFGIVSIGRRVDGMHVGHAASMASVQLRSEEMRTIAPQFFQVVKKLGADHIVESLFE